MSIQYQIQSIRMGAPSAPHSPAQGSSSSSSISASAEPGSKGTGRWHCSHCSRCSHKAIVGGRTPAHQHGHDGLAVQIRGGTCASEASLTPFSPFHFRRSGQAFRIRDLYGPLEQFDCVLANPVFLRQGSGGGRVADSCRTSYHRGDKPCLKTELGVNGWLASE